MVFVMLDGSLFGCYMVRWVVFWMLYGPMGRFLDLVWSDGSFFGSCMVRWVAFWILYGPMGRFLDVVWYDLSITKNH